jgi:ABC-type nitrate/sulfonate/bicarbonate transport system substrate-binding protein
VIDAYQPNPLAALIGPRHSRAFANARPREIKMHLSKLVKSLSVGLALGAGGPSPAQAPATLQVIVFPGGFNWPLWVAQEKGLFTAQGLQVELTNTPNSVVQMTGLIDGKFDIAMTAMDNVVAYNEGQGESGMLAKADLVAVLGADSGFLRLVASPRLANVTELKGRSLAVDALTTGYAFVLRELLERHGLKEGDFEFVKAGGVMQRFEGLMQNRFAATLLVSPFELQAQARGYKVLTDAVTELGHYQGVVAATRRDWARTHRRELVSYIKAYREALSWLYAPANKAEALALLRKQLPSLSEQAAMDVYAVLLHPKDGFTPDARLDADGIKTVLRLRGKYGVPPQNLDDVSRYIEPSYYHAAAPGR